LLGARDENHRRRALARRGRLKGDYARRDFARSAKFYGVDYQLPSTFPISSQRLRAPSTGSSAKTETAKALAAALLSRLFRR